MTAISVLILKIDESEECVKYSFGNPPERVLGTVVIYKSNGSVKLLFIENDKYKKHILPAVINKLSEHFRKGEFPDQTSYHV